MGDPDLFVTIGMIGVPQDILINHLKLFASKQAHRLSKKGLSPGL